MQRSSLGASMFIITSGAKGLCHDRRHHPGVRTRPSTGTSSPTWRWESTAPLTSLPGNRLPWSSLTVTAALCMLSTCVSPSACKVLEDVSFSHPAVLIAIKIKVRVSVGRGEGGGALRVFLSPASRGRVADSALQPLAFPSRKGSCSSLRAACPGKS